jgi:hypothetical protein
MNAALGVVMILAFFCGAGIGYLLPIDEGTDMRYVEFSHEDLSQTQEWKNYYTEGGVDLEKISAEKQAKREADRRRTVQRIVLERERGNDIGIRSQSAYSDEMARNLAS